jgi:Flp pilus assembly protein TadD
LKTPTARTQALPKKLILSCALLLTLSTTTSALAREKFIPGLPFLTSLGNKTADEKIVKEVNALLKESDFKPAERLLKATLKQRPNSALLNYSLANLYYRDGEDELALPAIKHTLALTTKALKSPPQATPSPKIAGDTALNTKLTEEAFKLLATMASSNEDSKVAIASLNKIIQNQNSNDIELYRLRGFAHLENNELGAVKADIAAIEKLDKNSKFIPFLEGEIALDEGRNQDAITKLTLAIGQGPNDPQVYSERSLAYRRLFNFDKARLDLRKAEDTGHFNLTSSFRNLDDYEYDFQNAEKFPARRWLLACAGPLSMQNDNAFMSLSGVAITKENVESIRKSLINWWGIHNREELLAMILKHSFGGHNASWQSMANSKEDLLLNPAVLKAFPQLAGEIQTIRERRKVVNENSTTVGNRGILAWDLGRNICLCRWGYRLGFLTKEEAYAIMLTQGMRIQQTYSSWKQYLDEYYIGRKFWDLEEYEKLKASNDRNTRRALMDPASPWCTVPWDTPLSISAIFQPESTEKTANTGPR